MAKTWGQCGYLVVREAGASMTTPKNPHAIALGKKGGAVKHPGKGMGAATLEERAARAAKMVAARRAKKEAK